MASSVECPPVRITTLDDALPRRSGRMAPVSIALHAAGLAALVLVPVLTSADLPEPATAGLRAFLVAPPSIAVPPPPPPPAPAAAARPVKPASEPARFVAPLDVPQTAPVAEASLDLGVEGGAPGGVEGGVQGGVVGGIIGGLPSASQPIAPVHVGGKIVEPRKVKDVPPEYPLVARHARVTGIVVLEALIAPDGRVSTLSVLRGIPLLNEAATEAVRQWVYTPTLLDGVAVPVIMTITVRFSLR